MSGPAALQRALEKVDGVKTAWIEVTPELASKWLNGNTHNRPLKNGVVDRYAADMRVGRWRQSHQGIAFDENGTLIDGQHRLFALVDANVPVLLQVTRGLPLETQNVIDDGLKRSLVDVMRISDTAKDGMTALHTSVAQRMFLGLSSASSFSARTRQEQAAFLEKHWEAVDFAVSLFPRAKRVRGVVNAGSLAAIARAYYHEDAIKLRRFGDVLYDGIPSASVPAENVITKIRTWLMTRKTGSIGGSAATVEVYAKVTRALRCYCHNEQIGRNIVPITSELYTLQRK